MSPTISSLRIEVCETEHQENNFLLDLFFQKLQNSKSLTDLKWDPHCTAIMLSGVLYVLISFPGIH